MLLTGPVETQFFAGDFRQWLVDTMEMRYDQLTASSWPSGSDLR